MGFLINLNLVNAYREIQHELWDLVKGPARKIPVIAKRIKKLEARSEAIRRRFQMPCPNKFGYGEKEATIDHNRSLELLSLQALTEAQKPPSRSA
jgi:hypothetical protein